MQTEMLHGDVIAGTSSYDELDHELVDAELLPYRPVRKRVMPDDGDSGCAWSADDGEEFADEYVQRLRNVVDRPDDDVRKDVLRALLVDSLVPMTVDAQVCDGVVTLTGAVTAENERADAMYIVGLVPGVLGIIDELSTGRR